MKKRVPKKRNVKNLVNKNIQMVVPIIYTLKKMDLTRYVIQLMEK